MWLLIGICPFLAISTYPSSGKDILNPVLYGFLGIITLALICCTIQRWRRLSFAVILIHSGFIIILLASLISAIGYIATVNIYEGDSTRSAFRWDSNSDIFFDFTLKVETITPEFYPAPVKIGVFKNGAPITLIQTKTGESFQADNCTITVGALFPAKRSISLDILCPGSPVTHYQTSPELSPTPSSSPLDFTLVAFKTPFLKKTWAELTIVSDNQPVLSKPISVNSPAKWNGLKFFLTATHNDPSGATYAGIQIVKDQGTPFAFSGFAVTCLGLLLLLGQKRQKTHNSS